MNQKYDLIVVGAGSGGLVVAAGGVGIGARVLLIESHKMGGDCLNYGCVPSKTFLKSAHLNKQLKRNKDKGIEGSIDVSLDKVMMQVQQVIEDIKYHDSVERFTALGVDVVLGKASFVDVNTIAVNNELYQAKKIVLACGTSPKIPDIEGLQEVSYLSNETIFQLKELPKSMVVLGGGPIGLELGQGFANLGCKVHIVERGAQLFRKDEPEVSSIMEEEFVRDGMQLHLGVDVLRVEQLQNKKRVYLKAEHAYEVEVDAILVALGREANTKGLHCDLAGIEVDDRGFVQVNAYMQTSNPNIYACGDVCGGFLFTHSAGLEAKVVIQNALVFKSKKVSYRNMSWCTYTSPEVAHVGVLEKQLKAQGRTYKVYQKAIKENDRSKAQQDDVGFVKVIVDKKGVVLGATIVSENAGELLASLAYLQTHKKTLSSLLSVVYPYPTQSQILQELAMQQYKESVKSWQMKLLKKIVRRSI